MTKIICGIKDCIHNIEHPEEELAYHQFQCGKDEIEIGEGDNCARCYSFEEKKGIDA